MLAKQYASAENYEAKLEKVMSRLGVEKYNYNWDRFSCWIEFFYKGNLYRFEHSAAQHIVCESALTSKGSAKHFFRSKRERERFVEANCCKNMGEGCVYYNCIMLRYEKEEVRK